MAVQLVRLVPQQVLGRLKELLATPVEGGIFVRGRVMNTRRVTSVRVDEASGPVTHPL